MKNNNNNKKDTVESNLLVDTACQLKFKILQLHETSVLI